MTMQLELAKKSIRGFGLSVQGRRLMTKEMAQCYKYPVCLVCKFLDLAPISYYYQNIETKDRQLEADMNLVASQHPTYGTRRLTHQLLRRPFSYQVGRNRVQRLARKMSLLKPQKRRKTCTTNRASFPILAMKIW